MEEERRITAEISALGELVRISEEIYARICNTLDLCGRERLSSTTKVSSSVSSSTCLSDSAQKSGDINGEERLRSEKDVKIQPPMMIEKKRKASSDDADADADDDDRDSVCVPDLASECLFNCPKKKRGSHGYYMLIDDDDDEDDDDDDDDDYEAAMFKHERRMERMERRKLCASNSAHKKKPKTQVDGNICFDAISKGLRLTIEKPHLKKPTMDETPPPLLEQGRVEMIGGSSAFQCLSFTSNKNRTEERLRREKELKKPMIDDYESETPTLSLPPWLQQGSWEKGSFSAATCDCPSFSPLKKKRLALTKQERLMREKCLKKPVQPDKADKSKKKKKTPNITYRRPATPPELPIRFRNMINGMGGTEIQMVIQKRLSPTDINHNQGRLSIPLSQITAVNFLTENEYAFLNNQSEGIPSMDVEIIDTKHEIRRITFKRWNLKKANGKTNPWYVLRSTWNDLVDTNDLKIGDIIQVWSFRVGSELHLAIVLVEDGDATAAAAAVNDAGTSHGNDTGIGSTSTASQSKEDTQKQ